MKNINKLTKTELTALLIRQGKEKLADEDRIKALTNENVELQRAEEGKPTSEQQQEIMRLKQKAIDLADELSSTKNSMSLAKRTSMPVLDPNQINGFLASDKTKTGKDILSTRNQGKCHMNISYTKDVVIDGKTHSVKVEDTKKIWLQVGQNENGSYWFSGIVFHDDYVSNSFIKPVATQSAADHKVDEDGKQTNTADVDTRQTSTLTS